MKNSTINILNLVLLLPILCFGFNKAFSQNKKVLPAPINTAKFTEYAPSISADGKTLIFESDRQGDWKLFESHLNGKNWSVPIPIPKITTTFFEKAPLGGPCLSYDGNLLLFSANGKDSDGHEDIYYSIREKSGWSAPMNFGKSINTIDYEGYPSLSADGKHLYFARAKYIFDDKKDPQQRCYRIMRAERGTSGKWETAIELPSPINLVCEKAPRIMPDGKTLMFSSIRKDGQGNFDIYKCTLQENGTWTDAVTLDFLNTSGPDQFVAVPACGEMMYYVMDGDIYTATVPIEAVATIQGYITDSTSNNGLLAKIMVSEMKNPAKVIAEFESIALDGRFSAVLESRGKYIFEISKSGFYQKKAVIDLSEKRDCETYEQDFRLIPLGGKIEVIADGFVNARTIFPITNIALGKQDQDKVKLATDSYNLTIKVVDAEIQKPIKEAIIRITDIKTLEVKEATKNKDNDFTANLKRSDFYELNVKAEDYVASPDQKIDMIPEGNAINFILSKKKRLPVNFAIFDVTTNKALKASFRVRLEKEQKSFSFEDEIEGIVKVAEREVFTVETSADGYKSIQSTFNMADFSLDKKYLFPIRLEKALFVLNLKAINKITNEAVTIGDYRIINLTVKTNKPTIVKLPLGDAIVSLTPENKYNLEIIAEGFEKFEQEIFKRSNHDLVCRLVPKSQASAIDDMSKLVKIRSLRKYSLLLYAIDARKKDKVPANFKIYDSGKEIMASGKTDILREQIAVILTEKTTYTLEITAPGYKPYEGKITPDSSMKNTSIASWLVKDDSKFTFKVLDAQSNTIVDKCFAKLTDIKSNQELILVKFGDEFSAELSPVTSYMLEIEALGYAKYINKIELNSERKKDIKLIRTKEPVITKLSTLSVSTVNPKEKLPIFQGKNFEKIEKGKAIVLNNVYFEQSSFTMQKESYPELDRVVLILKTNPQTKIEICGYTDNIGDQRLNLALSENRAKVILNYFVSKGIDEDRLLYKGYGGTKSVAPNDSEGNKKKNRRVEIVGIQ